MNSSFIINIIKTQIKMINKHILLRNFNLHYLI